MIRGVRSEDIDDRILPFLQNCADRSFEQWTVQELLKDIMSKDKQVWVIGDYQAVCLTGVGENHINVFACVGEDSSEWRDALDDELRAWAKHLGKKRIIGLVRPGWARWAKTRGYREAHRELVLEV